MPNRRNNVRSHPACLLCRQKKLRCDSVRPSCGNCAAKGVFCETVPLQHKPRPTNQMISSLESENELLRQKCAQLASGNAQVEQTNMPRSQHNMATNTATVLDGPIRHAEYTSPGKANTRREASENAYGHPSSLYHGPTSTYYDTPGSLQQETSPPNPGSDGITQNLLFAQTARQRQLEPLHLAAGRLDFDGVDPEIAMELLSIYWSRQLYTAQIVYRPVFMRDMACSGPYFSKLLLNAIYFGTSKHCLRPEIRSNPNDMATAGWKFRERFSELLRGSFDKSEITTIQALLIVSNGLFSSCDERSLSWLYAGNAFNMIIDLGLHVQPPNNELSPENLEVRRRVVWGAYFIDKVQCLLQGRPPLLRQADFKTPLQILDKYDELDMFTGVSYYVKLDRSPKMPCLNVTLLTKLCELSTIVERIMCDVYSESNRDTRPSQNMNVLGRIQTDLIEWRKTLPPDIDYLSSGRKDAVMLPQSLTLLALYNALIILAQRPLITDTYCSADVAHESITTSTSAANQILRIVHDYSSRYAVSSSPYLLSYATYISATIHALVVAQKGKESSSFQSLQYCIGILREQRPLYAAAEKARENLDRLMTHLGISITDVKGDVGAENDAAQKASETSSALPEQVGMTQGGELGEAITEFSGFPQTSWEFADLDLDALTQLFFGDNDLQSLMHPLGS